MKRSQQNELVRTLTSTRYTAILVAVALATMGLVPIAAQGTKAIWFALVNLMIAAGYTFLVFNVAPYFRVDDATKAGGIIFFFTCGATHVELALHTLVSDGFTFDDMLSWHMLAIHTVQALATWRFVLGIQLALVVADSRPTHDARR